MKHVHHIIPKHMGGTDDPSNLIELTVEEHSRAHYVLWNQLGREEDRIAWLSLSGQIGKEQARLLALISYNKTRVISKETREKLKKAQLGRKPSKETIEKLRKAKLGKKRPESFSKIMSKALTGRKLSESHKRNISKALKKSS